MKRTTSGELLYEAQCPTNCLKYCSMELKVPFFLPEIGKLYIFVLYLYKCQFSVPFHLTTKFFRVCVCVCVCTQNCF